MFVGVDRVVGGGGIHEGSAAAHVHHVEHLPAGRGEHGADGPAHAAREAIDIGQARAFQRERPVVVGEAFGEPQFAGHVGALEIEGFERLRADALDVPGVEKLVRHGADHLRRAGFQIARAADHGGVAMLHAVAAGVGHVVQQEGVVAVIVFGKRAEDAFFLGHHHLAQAGEGGRLLVRPAVVQGHAKLRIAHLPFGQVMIAEFHRAIHHAVHGGRGPGAVGVRRQLRGDLPAAVRRQFEAQGHRRLFEAVRPHHGSRQIQVRMGGVDAVVGAVGAVAEHGVLHHYGSLVPRNVPLVGRRLRDRQFPALAVRGTKMVDVFGELVQRVPAGRRAAHQHFQHRLAHAGKGGAHLRLMVSGVGKFQFVPHRLLRQ